MEISVGLFWLIDGVLQEWFIQSQHKYKRGNIYESAQITFHFWHILLALCVNTAATLSNVGEKKLLSSVGNH